jgi:hypothetical protein
MIEAQKDEIRFSEHPENMINFPEKVEQCNGICVFFFYLLFNFCREYYFDFMVFQIYCFRKIIQQVNLYMMIVYNKR